jgi:tetratricopeptide (TPR) repeat protein
VPLRPSAEAVGYALTFLQADQETRATVSLGTSGAFRLFVNGVKVAASDRYNLPRPDQHRLELRLRRGLNRVLLKVCQLSGPFGFYLRATSPGGALRAVLPPAVPPLEKGAPPAPQPLPSLAELLERELKAQPANAELRADLATVLALTRTFADTDRAPAREAERAALSRPADPEVALVAASLADDPNDRRRWLEQALAAAPGHPFARLQLAQLELSREHPALALELAERLLSSAPRFAPAWVVKVRALDALGQRLAAAGVAEAALQALPRAPAIVREAAAAARRSDRPEEALARWRVALALRADDLDARRALAGLLTELGRVDEAGEQLERVLAADPWDTGSLLRLADLLAANGRLADARARFAAARALAPEEPEVPEREGRALLFSGQREAALLAFERSLALRPQNPALKELVRTLQGQDLSLASAEAYSLGALLEEPAARAGEEDAEVLAEVTHVRVQRSGLASRMQQVVVRVHTQRGVEAFRSLPITWSPDRQEVRVMKARVRKPDGSLMESFSEQDRAVEPWAGMYFDTRARVLTFPALAPGDVLEVQWRLDDTAVDNLLSDYWGDVDALQGPFPKRHYRYVVDMPSSRPLHWNSSTLPPSVKASATAVGDRTVHRFEAQDLPRLPLEPQMAGWAEVAGVLHLSTYRSWEEVGRYYQGLVRDQLVPGEELRRTVEGLLKGVNRSEPRQVVAALYGFVVSNVRYVGLEFGIHGFQPYPVDRVLARRFGDCKDKASLLHAMLEVAGIDSRLVLLRTRDRGLLAGEVASLAAFNHAILYVPRLDLFLDGTAEFHGSQELPGGDRQANALVVEPEAPSRFLTTPAGAPELNTTTLTLEVGLRADGSADVSGRLVAEGEGAPELRRAYETVATRVATFEQQWAQSFPGVQASEVTVSDPRALEAPATLAATFVVPRYAEAGSGLLRFFPFGASRTFTQALAPLAQRRTDAILPGAWTNRLRFTYRAPPGWVVPALPPEVVETSPFGSLRLQARRDGSRLVVEGLLVMKASRVAAADYPAFRAWLLRVDQAFSAKLTLQRGAETAARAQGSGAPATAGK